MSYTFVKNLAPPRTKDPFRKKELQETLKHIKILQDAKTHFKKR